MRDAGKSEALRLELAGFLAIEGRRARINRVIAISRCLMARFSVRTRVSPRFASRLIAINGRDVNEEALRHSPL